MEMDSQNDSIASTEEFCTAFVTPASFEVDNFPVVQIGICIMAVPICLSTTVANFLVIVSMWRSPALHSPANFLLIGLAFSDFGVGVLTLPTTVISNAAKVAQDSSLFCKAKQAAWLSGACLCTVSLLTLSAINLDRYTAIHYHLRYREIVTSKRTLRVLLAIWITGCSTGVFYGVELPGVFMAATYVLVFTSIVVITSTSCLIQSNVRRHQKQIVAQMPLQTECERTTCRPLNLPRFKRSFKNTQILCFTVLFCYLPYTVITGVISATGLTTSKQSVSELCTLLLCFNSTLNPVIYFLRYGSIRASLVKLLQDLSCWQPKSRGY